MARVFTLLVGLLAVVAIAAAGWIYTDTKRDMLRLSTDIAQLRVSLDLYGRQQPTATNGAAATAAPANDEILDLKNRLAILENSWRSQTPAGTGLAAVPALPGETAPAAAGGAQGDCMPPSTRMLVTTGDSYPVCGTSAVVNVAVVSPGGVNLTDGTLIPTGGNSILKGTRCTLAVMSSGEDGMDGYAEVRVNC
ncbi:hypothetical protein [Devosia sp.]|uniref:hypothetical protein n=1 Tax=Devosia sp. TaxID=1871048 RepID=UPI0032668ACB